MSDRSEFERYQAFMVGYVNRINKATLNVTIGGVRIGTAKYSRLAQINLHTRIITFSRFAIENVPERGRRYLVLHELCHVKEANHTTRFWEIVQRYEPNYRQIGHALDRAFKVNVKEHQQALMRDNNRKDSLLLSPNRLLNYKTSTTEVSSERFLSEIDDNSESYVCDETEFDAWDSSGFGAIEGGSDSDDDTINSGIIYTPSSF
jgi:hypothetical protein